jgi:hypothetical protein
MNMNLHHRYIAVFFLLVTASPFLLFADNKNAVASIEAFIKKNTAKEFSCSEDQISVKDLGKVKEKHVYEAIGCNRTGRYTFGGDERKGEEHEFTCTCTKHCPDPNHPGGGTTCCAWDCK